MAHIYKMSEWQSPTGEWYCNDTEDLGHNSGAWWHPARILGIPCEEFVKLLVEQYKVTKISYNEQADVLIYSWTSQAAMRKYKNAINAAARKVGYKV